jgi:inner membrane protein
MDTSTHITIGIGLAGLAHIDPVISSNPELAQAILLGTIIGSNAPDFDYVIKLLKGTGMYTEHHRGASHSIPALFLWTFFVSGLIFLFSRDVSFMHLLLWTFIAVVLHVGFDIMNAYGTQAGRPITKKWLSLNFIPLFDPFIIFVHLIGFTMWLTGFPPGIVFFFGYILLAIYFINRYLVSIKTRKFFLNKAKKSGIFTIIPTIWLKKWHFVFETESTFQVGSINGKNINWIHHFEKHNPNCEIIKASLTDKNVQHFLANSKHVHALYFPTSSGSEVRWIDLRFRHRDHYPYMAVVKLDQAKNILASYTGWVHHSRKLNEKLLPSNKRAMQL